MWLVQILLLTVDKLLNFCKFFSYIVSSIKVLDCCDLGYALKGGARVSTIQLKNCNAEIASNSKFLFTTQEAFSECQQYGANNFTVSEFSTFIFDEINLTS